MTTPQPYRIFISLPMRGRTAEDIDRDRQEIMQRIRDVYLPGYYVTLIPSVFNLGENAKPLHYLGEAIKAMADASYVFFAKGWREARGCVIEYKIAEAYGLAVIIED